MTGTFEVLDAWRAALDAAGVRATTDSRAQYSSPAGYVLIPRPTSVEVATSADPGVVLMSGSVWGVCDGPDGTASWQALDALAAVVGPVIGEHLDGANYAPEVYTLAAMGLDQPAVEFLYSGVTARIY